MSDGVKWHRLRGRMVVFGGVRLRSEDRQRGRLSVVVYGLCVQRVQGGVGTVCSTDL